MCARVCVCICMYVCVWCVSVCVHIYMLRHKHAAEEIVPSSCGYRSG